MAGDQPPARLPYVQLRNNENVPFTILFRNRRRLPHLPRIPDGRSVVEAMKDATSSSYHERILRVQVHIQSHLDDALSLEELAGVACFSPFHFHRLFRAFTGEGVHEHVRRLRLERAAQRLKLSEQPVTDIAFDAGYESHEAFTRAFHAMFGMPPSQFRGTRYRPPDYGTPPPVEIKTLDRTLVVFLRHAGPYEAVGATWS